MEGSIWKLQRTRKSYDNEENDNVGRQQRKKKDMNTSKVTMSRRNDVDRHSGKGRKKWKERQKKTHIKKTDNEIRL